MKGMAEDDIVFAFDHPHPLGTVCRLQCEHNLERTVTGVNGEPLPPDCPLYILAEATEEQWRACLKLAGGRHTAPAPPNPYYYFVRTD